MNPQAALQERYPTADFEPHFRFLEGLMPLVFNIRYPSFNGFQPLSDSLLVRKKHSQALIYFLVIGHDYFVGSQN
jgi:hypothetical protein